MAWNKGSNTGPKGNTAKLDWAKVREMRALYAGGWTQGALCRDFGVSINTVGRIVRGETWLENGRGAVDRPSQHFTPPTDEEIAASAKRFAESLAKKEPQAKAPPSLDDLMRREAAKPDPAGDAALERLNEETRRADGGLQELLNKTSPDGDKT